jgi:hypothetical protein
MKVPKPVGRESSSKMGRMCLKAESVGAEMDMLDWFSFNLTSCQIGRKRKFRKPEQVVSSVYVASSP